jgi:hypothetical protein
VKGKRRRNQQPTSPGLLIGCAGQIPPIVTATAVERYGDPGFSVNKIKANERLLVGLLFFAWPVVGELLASDNRQPITDNSRFAHFEMRF